MGPYAMGRLNQVESDRYVEQSQGYYREIRIIPVDFGPIHPCTLYGQEGTVQVC